MPRRLFVGLFLLSLPLFATPSKDGLAYAIDARLGTCLQRGVPGLEPSGLLLGLHQAYHGETSEVLPERVEQLLPQRESVTTETPRIASVEARFLTNEKARLGIRELTDGVLASKSRHGQGNNIDTATQVHARYRDLLADGQVFDQNGSAG